MKILRTLYMITATVVLLPLILVCEIAYFAWLIVETHDLKKSATIWANTTKYSISMNLDFIKNGL